MKQPESNSTLIIGADGSMGKRYQAVLKHLDESYWCADKDQTFEQIVDWASKSDRIILSTPTDTHYKFLKALIPLGKPILCEKPVSKNLKELDRIMELVWMHKTAFHMTMQYSELVSPALNADKSYYNYFRTGNDGLVWDCIQIIGLAKGEIEIRNDSPIWRCAINGRPLNIADMDLAYVNFVRKWIDNKLSQSLNQIREIHVKTESMNNERNRKFN